MDGTLTAQRQKQKTLTEQALDYLEENVSSPVMEENEHVEKQKKEKGIDPAGNPAPETHKGKTYVTKLKEEELDELANSHSALVKERLAKIVSEDADLGKQSPEFQKILEKITNYTKIKATWGIFNTIGTENDAYNDILDAIRRFRMNRVEKKFKGGLSEEELKLYKRAGEYAVFFRRGANGDLESPPPNAETIDATKTVIRTGFWGGIDCDAKKLPLFPHEPSVTDIDQRLFGDCYLESGLASVVSTHPELIRQCLRDNEDGTVTVRFFERGETPVYVTVKKVVPRFMGLVDSSAANCLWAQMIERAYAASGFNVEQMNEEKGYRLDQKFADDEYERLKKEWKTCDDDHKKEYQTDFPYLFDEEGNLKRWEPSYKDVEAGSAGTFLEHLLGPTHKAERIDPFAKEKENDKKLKSSDYCAGVLSNLVDDAWKREKIKDKVNPNAVMFRLITHSDHDPATPEEEEKRVFLQQIKEMFQTQMLLVDDEELRKHKDFVDLLEARWSLFLEDAKNDSNVKWLNTPLLEQAKSFFFQEAQRQKAQYVCSQPLSGEYSQNEENIFNRITKAIADGKMVNAGTVQLEKGNEAMQIDKKGNDPGLNEGHAHTVLGTTTRQMGGKNFKFIKVRNPWSMGTLQYVEKEDGTLGRVAKDVGTAGVFLLELNDFVRNVDSLSIN